MTMAVQGQMFPAARFLRQSREINRVLGADEMEGGGDEERATDGLMEQRVKAAVVEEVKEKKAESTRERLKATSGGPIAGEMCCIGTVDGGEALEAAG
ncbi:uncharacterized protein TrAtP1_007029 [Trichoderma atroviride]|uniref:uncharacterized protein n=1 Tax=Hypocrea atroviridis TaxID=63577 RepID=UPI003316ED92|nr:hypothetical protein TrAtP1_007029 [Trichoderma atroviride]